MRHLRLSSTTLSSCCTCASHAIHSSASGHPSCKQPTSSTQKETVLRRTSTTQTLSHSSNSTHGFSINPVGIVYPTRDLCTDMFVPVSLSPDGRHSWVSVMSRYWHTAGAVAQMVSYPFEVVRRRICTAGAVQWSHSEETVGFRLRWWATGVLPWIEHWILHT